jgi:glycosyltransferase involved in cell wall biosynthesis
MSRILFLSRWFPYPPINGSKLRIFNLLQAIGEEHEISLLSFADREDIEPAAEEVLTLCYDVEVVPWKPYQPDSRRARAGFLSMAPRYFKDTFSEEMRAQIETKLAELPYDLVIASQIDMAAYSQYFYQIPALFEEAEVGTIYEQYATADSPWKRFRYGLTWAKYRRFLSTTLDRFEACTVASERERMLLQAAVPGLDTIEVIPNCVDLPEYKTGNIPPKPNCLIFTGAFTYEPNYTGMKWFLEEVFPLVKEEIPEVHLTITGDHGGRRLDDHPNVNQTGLVADIHPLIARAWASVVPLHVGGGTRLKILEAMAIGTPVVATSKGAEGLKAQDDVHLLIADSPGAYAKAVVRILRDPQLRERLAHAARRLVAEKYDRSLVGEKFRRVVNRVMGVYN